MFARVLAITVLLMLQGCSREDQSTAHDGDHVWKGQTDAVDKARSLEDEINDAFRKHVEDLDAEQR